MINLYKYIYLKIIFLSLTILPEFLNWRIIGKAIVYKFYIKSIYLIIFLILLSLELDQIIWIL